MRNMLYIRPELEGVSQLSITVGIMDKIGEMIIWGYYHDGSIVGGENILYYEINLTMKIYLLLLYLIASIKNLYSVDYIR